MSQTVGTIKITELKITTKKDGQTEVWSLNRGDERKFIVYKGKVYKLVSEDNSVSEE